MDCERNGLDKPADAFENYEKCTFNMSLVMRKSDFCICENKDADQLRSNCAADQRYTDSSTPLLYVPKSESSSL